MNRYRFMTTAQVYEEIGFHCQAISERQNELKRRGTAPRPIRYGFINTDGVLWEFDDEFAAQEAIGIEMHWLDCAARNALIRELYA